MPKVNFFSEICVDVVCCLLAVTVSCNSDLNSVVKKPSSYKDVLVASSEASMSALTSGANATKGVLSEKEVVSISSNDGVNLSIRDKQDNAQSLANIGSGDHHEKIRQIEAAIIVQAAIRGYQVFTSYIYTMSFGSYVHYQISKLYIIVIFYLYKLLGKPFYFSNSCDHFLLDHVLGA